MQGKIRRPTRKITGSRKQMESITAGLLVLVAALAVGADQPNDGFYLRTEGNSAPWIVSQDGQKVSRRAKQDLAIQKGNLLSADNSNTPFANDRDKVRPGCGGGCLSSGMNTLSTQDPGPRR